MITVVIADDHNLIREGFKKLIEREADIALAGEAENSAALFSLLGKTPFDVLILDISLPDKDGLDILKELKPVYPECKVLVLSMHPEDRYAVRALQNGASGYITKEQAPDELVKAIRKVYAGGHYVSATLAEQLASSFDQGTAASPHKRLSDREFQILLLIGGGKSINEIAETLSLSVNTVNTYRRRIFEKMDLHSNVELVQYVMTNHLID